jgi:hypothetical protein
MQGWVACLMDQLSENMDEHFGDGEDYDDCG